MDLQKIGELISALRKERSLTQDELGSKLGVSQKTVSRWETGRNMPDMAVIPDLCAVLGISIQELMTGEKIESTVTKSDESFNSFIASMVERRNRKAIAGVVISLVLMIICMIGLYNMEFSVRADSTSGLEAAINEYNFNDDLKSDVLEVESIGNDMYVLYRQIDHEGAGGLAKLERGIFGRYRILSCSNYNYPLINWAYADTGDKHYIITYCVNALPQVRSYVVYIMSKERVKRTSETPVEEEFIRCDLNGSPFMTLTEIPNDMVVVSRPESIVYYDGSGDKVELDELEALYETDTDAVASGTGTAETWLFYVYEFIILVLGIVMIRFFASDIRRKK
jgi:transcriptional regulator with XRE-family HTH domain